MRLLFFAAAAAHAVLVAILFTASVDVMLLSGIGVVVTLVTGVVGLVRKGIGAHFTSNINLRLRNNRTC